MPQVAAGYVRATQRPTASISLALALPTDGSLALGGPSLQHQQTQQQPRLGGGGSASADGLSPETRVYRCGRMVHALGSPWISACA